ncbi:SWIM zinc finger family protein [Acinetobacter corruptisaponis]|uniref:SWIM zinc finger family protein n=1 Tax=Acinetobacter corruptisaponis TaxID=3045147 RepID=A0ABY8S8Y2_9GAMM|nr:SWIM zinc finger family protein [Acinetobacter sp. KCTC 92772]WHP06967.1 SWIM zinc finger family protein [Acinetobacter sp. KCTC 92772]
MSWQQQYLAYDQESLATYANAGLVRRALKDIEAEKVTLQAKQAEQITIESDGQQVYLSATGLVNASCTCPATGACKHIVAAVLYLQQHLRNPVQGNTENQIQDTPELVENSIVPSNEKLQEIQTQPNLIEEILAFDLSQLAKKIGKAQTQKAIKLARLWQQEQQTELLEEGYRLKIRIKSLAEDIIYVAGAGFAGMLSNLEKDQPAYYLAALSEVQRLQGKLWAELELSEAENPAILSESERQFIVELKDDLAQLLEFGLSHVNEMTARQLHLLNMSARSESLPRLAAMLRQLSGQVGRLLNRDEHSSEHDTLLYLAQMSAYLYRLEHAQGEQLLHLRGKLRQQYQSDDEQTELELLPLGARWWRTLGGARGISLYFSELENPKTFEVTLARAENNDPNFTRHNAWSQQSIWMLTAQQLMQKKVCLQQPRFSEDGRLSASGTSRALPLNSLSKLEDFSFYQKIGFNDWRTLQQHWQQQLQTIDGIDQIVLLNISAYDIPQVDEIEQCLWWTVYDQNRSTLHLRLDWKIQDLEKIRQLERLCTQMLQVHSIFAYCQIKGHQLLLSPMSLLITQNGKTRLFNLDFDQLAEPKRTLKESIVGRIEQLLAKKKQHQAKLVSTQISLSQKVCEPILEVLLSLSCSGRMLLSTSQIEMLQQQRQLVQDAGMNLLVKQISLILDTSQLNSALLLRLVYVCDLVLRMQVFLPIQLNIDNKALI